MGLSVVGIASILVAPLHGFLSSVRRFLISLDAIRQPGENGAQICLKRSAPRLWRSARCLILQPECPQSDSLRVKPTQSGMSSAPLREGFGIHQRSASGSMALTGSEAVEPR